MISLAQAQAQLFGLRGPVDMEQVPLAAAIGRWVARDVYALRTQPARDLSAMDGYAVRHADVPGPWAVVGESAAGRFFDGTVGACEAVRIFTGAVVPDGADCILIQENAAQEGERLSLAGDVPVVGRHIRRAGGDFCKGALLVGASERVTAARIGLAAMGGHGSLPVHRRLRVALISTGDELVPPGDPCAFDQIPSSNGVMLATMLAGYPVDIDDRGIVRDDLEALTTEFAACEGYDVIVSIGGASVGDHDLVHPALEAAGSKLDFWKIAMRPGKPVMAGQLGDAIVLGLPGNPVSAFVTAQLLLLPLIAHLAGAANPLPERIEAELGAPLPANGPRLDHVRAKLTSGIATPIEQNDSSLLVALSNSNALIIRDIDASEAAIGDQVFCYRID
jgi:molybdopterin molybdotransferase